ncbi:hypothetical protein JCM5353_007837 [Sporobolomyces roseus]
MSSSSILHTVQVPAYDPTSGQLTLTSHHLVSAPQSYSSSFSSHTTLLFERPPLRPYDSAQESTMETGEAGRKKKKRRKLAQDSSPADWALKRFKAENRTTTDRESEEHHKGIVMMLENAIGQVRESWREENRFEEEGWTGLVDGKRCRWIEDEEKKDRKELDLVELSERSKDSDSTKEDGRKCRQLQTRQSLQFDEPVDGSITTNDNAEESIVSLLEKDASTTTPFRLVLPPSSGFYLSTFSSSWSAAASPISELVRQRGGFDLVIMDPPWPNASATRSSEYDTFDPYELWKLDLPELLGREKPVLIAIWLTNRVKYRRLLLDKLFPSWKLSNPVEWYWIKIASETGEPVWSLDSQHLRCYEGLVLGYYNPTNATLPPLPGGKVFLSTPIGHSRKPVLLDLLLPLLPPSPAPPNVLELFARTTLAGPRRRNEEGEEEGKRGFFLAVGNEAIKFNLGVIEERKEEYRGWIEVNERKSASEGEEEEGIRRHCSVNDGKKEDIELQAM